MGMMSSCFLTIRWSSQYIIVTSRISNILLSLWVEGGGGGGGGGGWGGAVGPGGCEYYPTNDIPNKYMYDAILIIYLSILLLCFHFLVLRSS